MWSERCRVRGVECEARVRCRVRDVECEAGV